MTITTEKAVALAEKHGAISGMEHITVTDGDSVVFSKEELAAMLNAYRQQVIEELAGQAGVLPEGKGVIRGPVSAFAAPESGTLVDFDCEGPLSHDPKDGEELYTEDQLREAIAARQAKWQYEKQATEFMREVGLAAHKSLELVIEKLGQSEARVAKFEILLSKVYIDGWTSEVRSEYAAMNKEQSNEQH